MRKVMVGAVLPFNGGRISPERRNKGSKRPQQGIKSLEIGLAIFRALIDARRTVALTELASLVDLHPSTVHRYCVSLIRGGLVEQDERGKYGLGPYAFSLGHLDAQLVRAHELAKQQLPIIVKEVGETAFLSSWGGLGPIAIELQMADKPISARVNVGTPLKLLNTSCGRTFAAFLGDHIVEPIVSAELASLRTEKSLTADATKRERQKFDRRLKDIRKRLLDRTTGERHMGLNSVTAPIFDQNSKILLTFTVFGLAETCSPEWDGPVAKSVAAAARRVMAKIGGVPPR